MINYKRCQVLLDYWQRNFLNDIAKKTGLSKSYILRYIISVFVLEEGSLPNNENDMGKVMFNAQEKAIEQANKNHK